MLLLPQMCHAVRSLWVQIPRRKKSDQALAPLHHEIPGRLGLLGFDNDEWAGFSVPSVSTIVQPAFQEGATAAALLIDNLRGRPDFPSNATLACEIILRGST